MEHRSRAQVASVAGAAGGISQAVCHRLAAVDSRLALAGRGGQRLDSMRQSLGASGATVRSFPGDLRDAVTSNSIVQKTAAAFGSLDLLVHCVGILEPGPVNSGGETIMVTHADRLPMSVFSQTFIRHYITTMRPYLMFVSGMTGIVGISFHPILSVLKAALLFVAAFCSYGFGQALTDCSQIDTDSISSPYRPLTQGIISRKHVAVVSVSGLLFCVAVFSSFRVANLALGLLAGLGLATYTPFKRRWWGGPFYNAWIVAVLCSMAFLGAAEGQGVNATFSFLLAVIAVFFGYANFVLSGYFKDIEADRQTGYRTLPVVFGRRRAAVVSDAFAILFLASSLCSITIIAPIHSRLLFSAVFWIAGAAAAILAQVRLHRVQTDTEAHRAIAPVVHAYILALSGVAAANNAGLIVPLLVFYAGFLFVLSRRPAVEQI